MANVNQISEAVILCGGKGTRLRNVVSDVPKPLAPINGKTFISNKYSNKMNLYQVEITTEIDTECILINANDENEAISIAQYMLENGEIDFAIGHEIINITAFLAC